MPDMIQDVGSGDIYFTVSQNAIYRITYLKRTITLVAGTNGSSGLLFKPLGLLFIGPHTLMVADYFSEAIRLVDIDLDHLSSLIASLK